MTLTSAVLFQKLFENFLLFSDLAGAVRSVFFFHYQNIFIFVSNSRLALTGSLRHNK